MRDDAITIEGPVASWINDGQTHDIFITFDGEIDTMDMLDTLSTIGGCNPTDGWPGNALVEINGDAIPALLDVDGIQAVSPNDP